MNGLIKHPLKIFLARRLSAQHRPCSAGIVDGTGTLQEVDASSTDSWLLQDFAQFNRHHEEFY